jgi:hypothetical protein
MRKIALFVSGSFIALSCLSSCEHSEAPKVVADM